MTILCLHCKPKTSRSRVILSRQENYNATFKGKRVRTRTMMRYRECLACRFRWKTYEYMPYPAKRKKKK